MIKSTSTKAAGLLLSSSVKVADNINPHERQKPEWLRIGEAVRLFGIGRSSLYDLLGEGRIKSASIRKRGNIRGIRLISAASLEAFLESIAEGGPRKKSKTSK